MFSELFFSLNGEPHVLRTVPSPQSDPSPPKQTVNKQTTHLGRLLIRWLAGYMITGVISFPFNFLPRFPLVASLIIL